MPDVEHTSPPLYDMRSTPGTLVVTGPDGQQTTRPIAIVHAPGATLPETVRHDAGQCGCRP